MRRDHIFLQQKLDAVCKGLKQSHRADAVRPDTILHPCRQLAFEQNEIIADARNRCDDDANGQKSDQYFWHTVFIS